MKKVYIYNWKQAYFYMKNGVMPVERPQLHFVTNNLFFVFNSKESQNVYNKWCALENKKQAV